MGEGAVLCAHTRLLSGAAMSERSTLLEHTLVVWFFFSIFRKCIVGVCLKYAVYWGTGPSWIILIKNVVFESLNTVLWYGLAQISGCVPRVCGVLWTGTPIDNPDKGSMAFE